MSEVDGALDREETQKRRGIGPTCSVFVGFPSARSRGGAEGVCRLYRHGATSRPPLRAQPTVSEGPPCAACRDRPGGRARPRRACPSPAELWPMI